MHVFYVIYSYFCGDYIQDKKIIKMNRFLLTSLLVAAAITANAQDNTTKDSLTMETMMHNIPEVMVKGSRPIVKAERGMLSYNMPLL